MTFSEWLHYQGLPSRLYVPSMGKTVTAEEAPTSFASILLKSPDSLRHNQRIYLNSIVKGA